MTMDFLSNIVDKMEQTKADLELLTNKDESAEKVIKLNPNDIASWEFRDRQDFELGDLEALCESILSKGQAQPIIVVKQDSVFKSVDVPEKKYIVIAGYRRWLACKLKNIPIDVIVRKLNLEQAVACLVSENEKEAVSDYSKGFFYSNLLKNERVTKKSIYEKLGIKRSMFDHYLSFAEVPKEIWEAVSDLSRVSARTAYTIRSICQKGEKEKNAILAIADKISLGIGDKKINSLVEKILSEEEPKKNATRVAFTRDVFIDVKENSLTLTAKKIKAEDLAHLKAKFTEILEQYFAKIEN